MNVAVSKVRTGEITGWEESHFSWYEYWGV